jgi:plastocyanin
MASSSYALNHNVIRRWGDEAFAIFFAIFTGSAILWLLAGLLPALIGSPWIHETFHRWGAGNGILAEMAENAALASHDVESAVQIGFDYLFSILNLSLGIFLILKGPKHRATRLLAIGMIGTAVAFNLQGHDARQIIPIAWLGGVELWHNFVHVLSGIAYVFALLLFPDGHFVARRRLPYLVFVTLIIGLFSLYAATGDHTISLVLLFGIVTPIAGITSQIRRFRRAPIGEARQQSKLILSAILVAFLGAAALGGISAVLQSRNEAFAQTVKDYTFTAPAAGTYYFVCDPHPETMAGRVVVTEGAAGKRPPFVTNVTAENIEFDRKLLVFPSAEEVTIRFTNKDGELHNVAIYRDSEYLQPVFDGVEFPGGDLARLSFQIFRGVFIVLPIALFVGILRFRLWEIDHLVNRAIVYASLTAILGGIYLSSVFVLGAVIRQITGATGRSQLVIAASTLAVAGLFRPVRRRLQEFIDRRFYRRRYDVARTLEAFNEQIRNEVDLEAVREDLIGVVRETMQPSSLSLWLRDPGEEPTPP